MSVVAERKPRERATVAGWRVALRRSPGWRIVRRIPFYLLVAAIFLYALFPFFWVIRSAFTPEEDLFTTPIQYIPRHPTLANFRDALSSGGFLRAMLNSTI